MIVNICGIPHKIIEREDAFNSEETHFGMISYGKGEIYINKDLPEEMKRETICHEMLHGILVHIGRPDLSDDQGLVQALANAIYNGFDIRPIKEAIE